MIRTRKRLIAVGVVGSLVITWRMGSCLPATFVYDPAPLVRSLKQSALSPVAEVPPPAKSIILANVRIAEPGAGNELTSIRVDNGVITQIGSDVGADLPVKHLDGAFVFPGLTDAHVHLSMAPGAAIRMDEGATSAELRAWHLRAYLASGVTTILDCAIDLDVAAHVSRWLAAGHAGPRFLHLGEPLVVAGGYVSDLFPQPVADESGARAHLGTVKKGGATGAKLPIEPGPFVDIWDTPSDALLEQMANAARDAGLPLYVHAMNEKTFARGLSLEPHAFVHHTSTATDAMIERTRAVNAYVITTLAVWDVHQLLLNQAALDEPHVALTTPPPVRRTVLDVQQAKAANSGLLTNVMPMIRGKWSDLAGWFSVTGIGTSVLDGMQTQTLRTSLDVVKRMHAAKVKLVVGSDSGNWPVFPYYLHGSSTVREIDLLVRAGIPSAEVLVAATKHPAQMLGLDTQVGTVALGKRADLVVSQTDPRADVGRALRRIQLVVRDGVARTPQEWMNAP